MDPQEVFALPESIETIGEQLEKTLSNAAQNLIEAGILLIRAKRLLGHGRFRDWLKENFSMSSKTANRFMNVATMVQRLQLKSDTVSRLLCLDLKTVYELAAKSTPESVQRQVIALLEQDRSPGYDDVRFLKKQVQTEHELIEEVIDFPKFTRRLQQFSTWFDSHRPTLNVPLHSLEDDFKQELQTCAEQLKQAHALVEELLAQASAISIEPLALEEPQPLN